MFYRKKLLTKRQSLLSISYSAFSKGIDTERNDEILPHRQAKEVYNYNISDGSLKCGYGFSELMLPVSENSQTLRQINEMMDEGGGLDKLWFFRYFNGVDNKQTNYVFCHGYNDKFFYFRIFASSTNRLPLNLNMTMSNPTGIVYMLNGQDVIIFTSPTDDMIVASDNMVSQVENAPKLRSMCVHYERVFAILEGTGKRLVFSANLDPTNWNDSLDEAGYIEMADERGRLLKVISFNDYVYVFRENGVTRVSGYGDQTQFSVSHMFVMNSLIYGETVTVCESKVMFLARDGVHIFNGAAEIKLNLGIDELFDGVYNNSAVGAFSNGKYYLACRLNFNDNEVVGQENESFVNNSLIEIDLNGYKVNITRGVDICDLCVIEDGSVSKIIASFRGNYSTKIGMLDESGALFGTPLLKKWTSPFSGLGYAGKLKRVKELFIESATNCEVRIRTEREFKTYLVRADSKPQRLKTDVLGEKFEISFVTTATDNVKISCPTVRMGVI